MIESIWRRMLAAMATIMEKKKKLYISSLDVNNCDCQLSPLSLSNVMATLARARTAATGSSSVVDLAFDVVPPPV